MDNTQLNRICPDFHFLYCSSFVIAQRTKRSTYIIVNILNIIGYDRWNYSQKIIIGIFFLSANFTAVYAKYIILYHQQYFLGESVFALTKFDYFSMTKIPTKFLDAFNHIDYFVL